MKPYVLPDIFENTYYFDVDDTLIEWANPKEVSAERLAEQIDLDPTLSSSYVFLPIHGNISFLKSVKDYQGCVVVWSKGGSAWASKVVEALGLNAYVDCCLSKPDYYVDDLPAYQWMGEHLFYGSAVW